MIVYEQNNGEIKCLQGGREYITQLPLNRAIQKDRQPGSTFKPLISYGPALEMGLKADDIYVDSAINIKGYKPSNAYKGFMGPVTVRKGIQDSINTISVQILNDIEPQNGYDFATKLGIKLQHNDRNYLGIALGGITQGVSVLEMCRAFGVFGNEGVLENPHTIKKIVNQQNITIYEYNKKGVQVISPSTAWLITDLLISVVKHGVAHQSQLPIQMAGKTGTTQLVNVANANKDLWYIGYTPNTVVGIWMGFDHANKQNALYSQYGGGYPCRLWKAFMSSYTKSNKIQKKKKNFTKPNPLIQKPRSFQFKNISKKHINNNTENKKEQL